MVGNKAAEEKSAGPEGDLFDLKQKHSVLSDHLLSLKSDLGIAVQIKKLMRNSG